MDIPKIENPAYNPQAAQVNNSSATQVNAKKSQETEEIKPVAKKEEPAAEFIQSNKIGVDRKATLAEMKRMDEERMASFRSMLNSMLIKQGEKKKAAIPTVEIYSEPAQIPGVEEAPKEDDQSVEAVSGRILDMAKSLANGDTSKIGMLKKAVQKAFDEVEQIYGGKLPDITKETYDAVMKGFEQWENPSKEPELKEPISK